ncbi:hypothetical protein U1Q18_032322 [Sarracenia purpurea var. burkii]
MGETSNSSSPVISPTTLPKDLHAAIAETSPENTKFGQGEKMASNGGEEIRSSQYVMGGITEDPMDFQMTNLNQIPKISTNLPNMGYNRREGKEVAAEIPNNALWNEQDSKKSTLLKLKEINPEKGQISPASDIILGDLTLTKLYDSTHIPDSAGLIQKPLVFPEEISRFEGGKKEKLHQDPNPHFGKSKQAKILLELFKDSIEVGKEDSTLTFSGSSQIPPILLSESGKPLPFLTEEGTDLGLLVEDPLPGLEPCGSGENKNEGIKPSLRKRKTWARKTRPSSDIDKNNHICSKKRIDKETSLYIPTVAKKAENDIKLLLNDNPDSQPS